MTATGLSSKRIAKTAASPQVAERRYLSEESMAQLTPPAQTAINAATTKPEVIDTDATRTA